MTRLLALLIFAFFAMSQSARARVVNSMDDEVRLQGFDDQLAEQKKADDLRLSDVGDIQKEREAWQEKLRVALEEYRIEKSKQEKSVDDTGAEYEEELQARLEDFEGQEEDRADFIADRDEARKSEQRDVKLSEEAEYFIAENTDRVDWNKRHFFDKGSSFGSMGSPGVYVPKGRNSEIPPPPPPAMPYEQAPQQNWEAPPPPPPPPPGMFEEENPF